MSDRSSAVRLVVWLGIVVLAVYATLVGGTYLGIETQVWRGVSTVLAGAVLGLWLGVGFAVPAWRPRTALWVPIGACLGVFAVSSLFAWDPRISFEMTAYAVLLTGLYLLGVRLMGDPFFRPRFGALAFALCATICAAYLVNVARDWIEWWGLVGRLAVPPLRPAYEGLTFQTPNVVATVTVLLYALAAAHLGWSTRATRIALGILGAAVGVVVIITASRGAWAAIAAGFVVLAAAWLSRSANRALIRRRLSDRRTAGLALVGVAVVVGLGVLLLPRVLSRFAAGGEGLRLGFISAALRMFAERPLTGSGPGTWVIRRAAFTQPGEPDLYVPHAHDIYAQTLAEFGILGIVAGVLLIGGLLWLVWTGLRGGDPVRGRFALATLFALVFLGVQQVVDFFVNLPAVLLPLALLVAGLDATSPGPFLASWVRTDRPGRWRAPAALPTVAVLLATALALLTLAPSEATAGTEQAAVTALSTHDPVTALPLAVAAAAADPTIGAYQLTLALAAAGSGTATTDDTARATAALRTGAEHDQLAESWLDLAALRLDAGDRGAARLALESALRLGIQRPSVALPAGSLWLKLGDTAGAVDAFAAALSLAPSLAGDPYWTTMPEGSAVRAAVVEAAMARAGPAPAWEIALLAGHPSEPARRALLESPQREVAEQVAPAWAGDASAREALVRIAVDDPHDGYAVGWCARLAARAGDVEGSRRFRRWLITVDPVLALAFAFDRRIETGPVSDAAPADNQAAAYGAATYRRGIPPDVIVDRLPRVVLAP